MEPVTCAPQKPAPPSGPIEHQPGFRTRRGINWFLLGLMYASYYTCRYNISIAAPRIIDEFGFSRAQFGLINTGRHWSYAVGQFVNGLLTDRLGGKQAMAVGAIATIALNLLFGLSSYAAVGSGLVLFVLIRCLDGYFQAFGAPGFVKINTSWFPRRERGRFAGIFGLMIQLGQISMMNFGPVLLAGFPIFIGRNRFYVGGDWRWLFWLPPAVVAVVLVLMYAIVRNEPEEVGYHVEHDPDEARADASLENDVPLSKVFATIVRKKMVWLTAAAYFCTGVVRTAQFDWFVVYFEQAWGLNIKTSPLVKVTAALLPITAFFGSIASGYVSDLLFRGRRAPVAMALYATESLVILAAALMLSHSPALPGGAVLATPTLAAVFMILISLTCNSTHSILGTAAAMDLGGRKMAGFSLGLIDSFQYIGAGLSGQTLGYALDQAIQRTSLGWNAWFWFMLPFSLLGMLLMGYITARTRGRDVPGG